MDNKLKVWHNSRYGIFTIASEIEKYSINHGGQGRIDPNGTKHPGSLCNMTLRRLMSEPALKKKFSIQVNDYGRLIRHDCPGNDVFIQKLLDEGYIHSKSLQNGGLDIYLVRSATAIISALLEDGNFKINEDMVEVIEENLVLRVDNKNLDLTTVRPKNSLLKPKMSVHQKVINMMPEEGRAWVRLYFRLVRQTREEGRQIIKKGKK